MYTIRKINLERKVPMEESSGGTVITSSSNDIVNLENKQIKKPINQNSGDQKWLILKQVVGKGGYGCVYNATYKNNSVIVKSSLTAEKNKSILGEYEYLKLFKNCNFRGIPKVEQSFVDNGKQCFMMEKLGTDLEQLRNKTTEKKFSLKTTVRIALQVLQILKSVHSLGILHLDIKPDNLMTGRNDPNTIYLIDFGLAKRYIKDDEHIPREFIGVCKGTDSFNSLNALKGKSLSRRDDLESLAYTLIKLRTGKLPWGEIARDKEMCKRKKTNLLREGRYKPSEEICDGMCEEFVMFLNEVRSLRFKQKPDYGRYYTRFDKLLNKLGFEDNDEINWN